MTEKEIKELLSKEPEEIFLEIGKLYITHGGSSQFGPLSKKDIIELGKKYYHKHIKELKKAICGNDTIESYLEKSKKLDDIDIILSIMALLNKVDWLPSVHIPVFSIVVFNTGLRKLCD